jgi:hypothetical protein
MNQSFTKEFMLANRGCYDSGHFLMKDTTLKEIVESEIRIKDKFWFICKKLATKEENQQIAIRLAEIVLPIYEKRYPENKAPREAIEAAKSYIAGHISLEQLLAKKRAAAIAAAIAYAAAYAAYAAADAAAAAAAAYAAYAAADADAAAAAAADYAAAEIKQQLQDYLNSFIS